MARTSEEIEQIIEDEANSYVELVELQQNTSMMAFWTYAKKVIVFVVLVLEKIFDKHKEDVSAIIDKTETGSIDWYLSVTREYQHGDSLIIDNNRPVYSIIDEAKQIIKRVAIKEDANASMYFRLVKQVNGEFVKLTAIELSGATSYLHRKKIAGTKIIVESVDADLLDLAANLIVDGSIIDVNGALLSDNTVFPVIDAINNHLINFDATASKFYLSSLIDSVMNVEGVIDFHITETKLNSITFTRNVESAAGYIKLDSNTVISYVLS
jgi:hypothetical protein